MVFRIALIIFLLVFAAAKESGAQQHHAQETPFTFVQRSDVGREIGVLPNQLETVERLQPACDARCQQRLAQNFDSLSDASMLAFGSLGQDAQQRIVQDQSREVREEVELDFLDMVLSDDQMSRMQQLFTQFRGLDALTSGQSSRELGTTEDQANQIRDLQNASSELISECQQNSGLSVDQQSTVIGNIQNALIDQSISILENGQLNIFINLCGEPCQFDSDQPDDGAEQTPDGQIPGESTDADVSGGQPTPSQSQQKGSQRKNR